MFFRTSTVQRIAIAQLEPLPNQGYAVGGAVRDLLLKKPFNDIDWVVPSPYEEAKKAADRLGGSLIALDEHRNFWRVVLKNKTIDYTPLVDDIEKDLAKRDFTINAIAVDLKGKLIDPTKGIKDFKAKRIRMVHKDNFYADSLRSLRGVRFAVQLGFNIETKTREVIKKHSRGELLIPKAERINEELSKILLSEYPAQGIKLMDALGLLAAYLPELAKAKGVKQGGLHHLDVLNHSIEALRQLVQTFPEADLSLRWATLLHDIAKPQAKSYDEQQRYYHFYGHDKLGAEVAQNILKRLKTPKKLLERVSDLIRYHMLPLPKNSKEARRFVHRRRKLLPDLLKLMIADREAARGKLSNEASRQAYKVALSRVLEILAEPLPKKPLLNGLEVMEILNLEPSAKIGQALSFISEAEAVGDIANKENAIKALEHYASKQNWL